MRPPRVSLQRRDFDKFLYSAIREVDGMPLTVLSVLARLDMDPSAVAENLTRLPPNAAADQLSELITRHVNEAGQLRGNDLTTIQLLATLPEASAVRRWDVPTAWQSLANALARLITLFSTTGPSWRKKQ